MKALPFAAAASIGSIAMVLAGPTDAFPLVAPSQAGPHVVPAAFGDLPVSGGRRRGRRPQRDSKPSAPPEVRTEPQGETAEQHKAYLKRYGF